ncbi:hypothetical protein VPH35_047921 [Triticum aestivum]
MRPGREWKGRRGVAMAARSRLLFFFSLPCSFFTPCCCFFLPPSPESLAGDDDEEDVDDKQEVFFGSTLTSEGPRQNPMAALLKLLLHYLFPFFLSSLCSLSSL